MNINLLILTLPWIGGFGGGKMVEFAIFTHNPIVRESEKKIDQPVQVLNKGGSLLCLITYAHHPASLLVVCLAAQTLPLLRDY